MNRKMKRTFLDIETKAEVIKKIRIGVEKEEILQKYEIAESLYYKFLRHESEIMNNLKKPENKDRRLFKKLENEYLDDAVIKWFQQTRDRGVLVTGPMICEKAKVFNDKLNGPANFEASSDWLSKLKKRCNIKCSEMNGESFTYSTECIEEFSKSLKKKIINEKLLLENIYNADEAGIYWRTIVSSIKLRKLQDNNLFHLNNSKDLITVLFCSNASGNHRIPLLLIGNEDESACLEMLISNNENSEEKTKSLNELSSIGIIYANQENSRICQKLFKDWFENIFIPRALDFQRDSKISGKILLILDNAPCHPPIDELNAINKNIEVLEIPTNVSALLQPMSQSPINMVKKFYKQNILHNLLNFNTNEDAYKYLLNFNYKNAFPLIKNAWMNKIQESTLKNAWQHFLGKFENLKIDSLETISDDDNDLIENVKYPEERNNDLLKLLQGPSFQMIGFSDTIFRDWYNEEIVDSGWNEMSDSDIVDFVQQNSRENGRNLMYEDNDDDYDDCENSCEENLQSDDLITASQAYENLQIIKTWIRQKTSQLYVNNFTLEEIDKMLSQGARISPSDDI